MNRHSLARLLIINDHAHINGGASRIALTSARGLAGRGIPVSLFTAVMPISDSLESVEVLSTEQQEILRDSNRFRAALQGYWNWPASREIDRLLENFDPAKTVVHLHSWTKSLSSSVIRKVLQRGFRIVCTLHDYFTVCPNGGFFDYPAGQICQRAPLSADCIFRNCDVRSYPQKLWRCGRQIVQQRLGGVPGGIQHFIAYSQLCLDILRPFLPEHSTLHFVENPIDIAEAPRVTAEDHRSFIFAGRISREKGPHLFARAAQETGVEAVFIGDGPLAVDVQRINPSSTVTGWVPPGSVQEAMRSARALVFPSLWYETQGLAVLEAAAVGIPAIVPDTSAAREFVEDGVTGLWFNGGKVESLKEKIFHLQDNGTVRRLSENAYARYWGSPNTLDNHVDKLLKVYDDILRT